STIRYRPGAPYRRRWGRTFRHRPGAKFFCSLQWPHHSSGESIHDAFSGQCHQLHGARLAGLEAHRSSGCDIESKAVSFLAIEGKRIIGFEEMVVRSDLDRPVARISHFDFHRGAPAVQFDLAGGYLHFAWDHFEPCSFLESFVQWRGGLTVPWHKQKPAPSRNRMMHRHQ